jgi:hypothetical protein
MSTIKIIALPSGQWCLELDTVRSPGADYSQRIIFQGYVAQTAYWGVEGVWKIECEVPFTIEDHSI